MVRFDLVSRITEGQCQVVDALRIALLVEADLHSLRNAPERLEVRHRVKDLGKRVGLAINPATPAPVLEEVLPDLDLVLVMTVNPGFGHQHFIHSTLAKIQRVRRIIQQVRPECELELDGGIDETTAPLGVAAGANVLVAGTSIFGARQGIETAMRRLREATK